MSSQNTQTVLATVVTYIGQELKTGVGSFLDQAEQTLYADTSPRSGARDHPTSYAAARWLGNNRESLEAAMQRRLTDSFFGRARRKDMQFDELQLLDDEALSVVIVRARMVSQVMERARDAVVVLEARLEALRAAGADINPKALNPGLIADGFIGVLNELEVPKQVQAPLLDAFGVRGVDMLVKFYDGINKLLIENGVLPDFKRLPAETEHAGPRAQGAPAAAGVAAGPAPPGMPAGAAGLMHGGAAVPGGASAGAPQAVAGPAQAGMAPAGTPAPGAAPSFAAGMIPVPAQFMPVFLDAKITLMQQALANLSFEDWQPGTLRDSFKLPPPFALTPEQEESVDHLEAVFLDLMRDPRISARFRQQMSQLILPLMMLRLKESDQLADPDNAVRRFVRQLALLGFRDQDSPIESFDAITTVVGRIVSERAQEIASFRSGADALHTIALKEVQRQLEARHQQRRQEAAPDAAPDTARAVEDERRRLVREAHQHVLGELRLLSAGMQLPPPVQQYVVRMLGPWMMIRYQRHGVESEPMRDARSFAMMFFRLLTPATSRADHDTKVALRKHALEEMEVRAARSGRLDPELRETILTQIEKLYGELDDDPQAGVHKEFGDSGADCTDYLDGLEETVAD